MLKPEYLRDLPDELVELYSEAELRILDDMARRIHTYDYWIPAVEHQKRQLALAGRTHDEILSALQSLTGKTQQELKKLMQQAASETLRTDAAVYQAAGLAVPTVKDSEPLKRLLNIGYKELTGEFKNICRTTAKTAARQLEHALDVAWLEVQSGAIDANTSIRNVVRELADNGLQAIKYQSGRTDSLEVAVRRAVVTGVNQTCGKMQEELADEIGCDLMELTAHAGARPEHAVWQGKIVSRSGQPGYLSLSDIGYGSPGGFKGVNCRHDWGPYIEGSPRTWTDEELAKLNEPKYDYNGKKLTRYEAEQQQRANERRIRKYKREFAVLDATGQDTGAVSMRLKDAQARQHDFLKQTGLKRQYDREQIYVANSKKRGIMNAGSGSVFIESINKPIEQRHTGKGNPNAVLHFDVELNNRQQRLLDALPEYNSSASVPKGDVSMTDLAALTAKTGDEFAMFTREGTRLVIRGNSFRVEVTPEEAYAMGKNGYVWSGHTHPGTDMNALQPSDGDYAILNQFNQNSSAIYNSTGNYLIFERTEPYV